MTRRAWLSHLPGCCAGWLLGAAAVAIAQSDDGGPAPSVGCPPEVEPEDDGWTDWAVCACCGVWVPVPPLGVRP